MSEPLCPVELHTPDQRRADGTRTRTSWLQRHPKIDLARPRFRRNAKEK